MNIHSYELSTNDCTAIPSDLQAGVTCVAKGKKITGTGKSFSFATYGGWLTNESDFVSTVINTVLIGSVDYPVIMTVPMNEMRFYDFSSPQKVADVVVDGVTYPITLSVQDGEFLVTCEKTINIQLFIGKDEYIYG
jgi:hypothetical protein